ncbi:multidrug resistance protein [Colletotrichum tofieldiae]|nr:multidrug resistance protein [Colletotrichum tofieldiae]
MRVSPTDTTLPPPRQIRELQTETSQVLGFLFTEAVTAIAFFALSLSFSWKLAFAYIAIVSFAVIALTLTSRELQPVIAQQKQHLADASKQVHACVIAIHLVKVYNDRHQKVQAYERIMDASVN